MLLAWAFALLASSMVDAATVKHIFTIGNMTINRLYNTQVITAVNGKLPGSTVSLHTSSEQLVGGARGVGLTMSFPMAQVQYVVLNNGFAKPYT